MKKILTSAMCLLMALSCVACGGGGNGGKKDYGNKVVIKCMIAQGGIGTEWMTNAAKRYETIAADKQFGDKVGVVVEVDAKPSPESNLLPTDGNDILTPNKDIFSYIQQGLLMDLSELYTRESAYDDKTIAERVRPEVAAYYQGLDGKYYGLPHNQYYSGVTYNKVLFDDNLLYFAYDEANGDRLYTDYGSGLFVKSVDSKKSVGPDLLEGTEDDGLPSSLEELIILCKVMKDGGIEPFQLAGKYVNYSNSLTSALTANLAGAEQMKAIWELDGGEVEVIKEALGEGVDNTALSYTSENLFEGINYIKKPEVTTVNMSMESGWRRMDMTAKYYAIAFMEIAEREGFFSSDSYIDTLTHIQAQENFVLGSKAGGTDKGMYIDGSFWYNESLDNGVDDTYAFTGEDLTKLDLRFMPLPHYVTNAQRDSAPKADNTNVLCMAQLGQIVVQKRVENDPVKKAAVLDFLDFLLSTEENINYTVEEGMMRGMEYNVEAAKLQSHGLYTVNLVNLIQNSTLISQASSERFLKAYAGNVYMGIFGEDTWWTNKVAKDIVTAVRNGKKTQALNDETRLMPSVWNGWRNNLG